MVSLSCPGAWKLVPPNQERRPRRLLEPERIAWPFAQLQNTRSSPRCGSVHQKGIALGWLEAMWHFAGRFTPHGNLGKYPDQQIEAWVERNGVPGALIAALIETGWLDSSEAHRILVHDCAQHADNATKLAVKRSGQPFIVDAISTACAQGVDTVAEAATLCGLPGPLPEPGAGAEPSRRRDSRNKVVPHPEPTAKNRPKR